MTAALQPQPFPRTQPAATTAHDEHHEALLRVTGGRMPLQLDATGTTLAAVLAANPPQAEGHLAVVANAFGQATVRARAVRLFDGTLDWLVE
jgi:hypothetical protein